jgi:hypothetical protein
MAYRRLIDAYYTREGPLPLDRKQVYRLTMCENSKHKTAVDVVLAEFFCETEEGWRCKPIEGAMDAERKRQVKNRSWESRLDVGFGEWQRLRSLILESYENICAYCGGAANAVDHFVPISLGGESCPDNLLAACKHCNSSKGDKTYQEWRAGRRM